LLVVIAEGRRKKEKGSTNREDAKHTKEEGRGKREIIAH